MLDYFEVAPPAALADTVECFWIAKTLLDAPLKHLVVPDGCADLLFTRIGNESALQFIGPMTKFERFALPAGQLSVAARFHPGCWTHLVHTDADLLTDRIVPFETLAPRVSRRISEQMTNELNPRRIVSLLAISLPAAPDTRLTSALQHLAASSQPASLDSLAFAIGLSTRQFRRCIRQQTGLSPKLLARILRLRRAAARVRQGSDPHAELAISCGYADQSHFIAEYRHFTGQTPSAATASQPA